MRFHFSDTRRHRQLSKSLAAAMRKSGLDIGHTAAADLAARLYGYADAHELAACAGRSAASLWDEDEAPGIVSARRARQVSVLVWAGLDAETAGKVVDGLAPTSRSRKARDVATGPKAMADDGLDVTGMLDAWEWSGMPHGDRFAEYVSRAYASGRTTVEIEMRGDFDMVLALDPWNRDVLAKGASSGEFHDWLAGCPAEMDVAGPSGRRVRVCRVSSGSIYRAFRYELLDNLYPEAPSMVDQGFHEPGRFAGSLLSRVGLHIMCCPGVERAWDAHERGGVPSPGLRLPESIRALALEGGIRTYGTCSPDRIVDWKLMVGYREVDGAPVPEGPSLGIHMPWFDGNAAGDVTSTLDALKRGYSVVAFSGAESPVATATNLLASGFPVAVMRRAYLTGATLGPDGIWRAGGPGLSMAA